MEYVEELLKIDGVLKGGAWRPTTCQAFSKVAIIVPYRNRYAHLKIFLRHIHPFLHRQLLDYRIIVVEQNGDTQFNRALLLNIGYKEALKLHDFQCFVFHDVDHIPENDRHSYGCRSAPTHMSIAVDKWHYKLPYKNMFGGVSSFMKEHFEKINGFSNKFWGWGGEDDDSRQRFAILRGSKKRMMEDGLNSLKYDIVKREEHPLYTNILVDVDPTAV